MAEQGAVGLALARPGLKAILQRGVGIPVEKGMSVREFLEKTLGIHPSYVEHHIQTVFLDGHPVDDFDRAAVGPGSVLALSGAMPGLAGATLRRGGYYARLREGISHEGGHTEAMGDGKGVVLVKLFNRALADLAEILMGRSILVPADLVDGRDSVAPEGGWVKVVITLAEGEPA